MNSSDKKQESANGYPRPSDAAKQLQNQPEYINQEPNNFHDKTIGKVPVKNDAETEENKPDEDINHQRNSENWLW